VAEESARLDAKLYDVRRRHPFLSLDQCAALLEFEELKNQNFMANQTNKVRVAPPPVPDARIVEQNKSQNPSAVDPRIDRDEKVAQKAYASALEMSGGDERGAQETLRAVRLMRGLRRNQEDILKQVALNNEQAFRFFKKDGRSQNT
jgi:hypothetical protein